MRSADVGEPLEPWRADWSAGVEQTNELLWLLRVLRLRWKMIVVVAVLLTTSAALVLRQITPLYSATADILIDAQQAQYADLSAGPGAAQTAVWPAELETYVKVVWSDRLASDVVQSIGPAAFEEPPSPWSWVRGWVRPIRATVEAWLGWLRPTDGVAASSRSRDTAIERAVHVFHRYLRSSAIRSPLPFTSPTGRLIRRSRRGWRTRLPRRSPRSSSGRGRRRSPRPPTIWASASRCSASSSRRPTLKCALCRTKCPPSTASSVSEMRYRELLQAVSEAEAQFAVAYADVARMEAQEAGELGDAAVSETLADLRREERSLGRELAEVASTIGEKHPTMLALRAEQADIQAQHSCRRGPHPGTEQERPWRRARCE